ncbi:hypothetical protein FHR88_006398 [Bradyrhizobium betae]|nr:hypothetical protein [Bradyrhizobium betae]
MIGGEQQRQQQSTDEDEISEDRHEHPRARPMNQDAALTGKTGNRSDRSRRKEPMRLVSRRLAAPAPPIGTLSTGLLLSGKRCNRGLITMAGRRSAGPAGSHSGQRT